MIKLNGSWN